MKIGYVLDDGLDKPDGVQQTVLALGKWMRDKGHEVNYLVGATYRNDLPGVFPLSTNLKVNFNGNTLSVPLNGKKRVKEHFAKHKYDVLHVQMPYSPLMAGEVLKKCSHSTAVIGTFHILPYGMMSRIGSRLLALALKPTLKRFDSIASVSLPAQKFASKAYAVKSEIISNPVDISYYMPNAQKKVDQVLRILFVGRLVKRKGCMQLLKALDDLNKNGYLPDNIEINICGDGKERVACEKFSKENSLKGIVNFHGFVSEDTKRAFMQQADISVFPSISGESFGIVLIEAAAAGGGIVLAGDNPGYRSVLGNIEGSLVNPTDITLFARQLKRYISSTSDRKKLYRKQQARIKSFDINLVGEQYLSLYNACKINRPNQ